MSAGDRPLAVITGASRGIGAAIAHALAPTHALLLVARTRAATDVLAAELSRTGAEVDTRGADFGVATDVDELARGLAELAPDVLVNNAGRAHSAALASTSTDDLMQLLAVNLVAPFQLARALASGMAQRGRGRIVNIASTAALKGYRYTAAYSASKGALVGLTRALAAELASTGITVNAVCPGFCDTDIAQDAVKLISSATKRSEADARKQLEKFNPLGRLVQPAEVAAMVAYLCSSAAASVNGQAFAIDGGETA